MHCDSSMWRRCCCKLAVTQSSTAIHVHWSTLEAQPTKLRSSLRRRRCAIPCAQSVCPLRLFLQGLANIVRLLLSHGADPAIYDRTGQNAMMKSCRMGTVGVCCLVEARLLTATSLLTGRTRVIQVLLDDGKVDPNLQVWNVVGALRVGWLIHGAVRTKSTFAHPSWPRPVRVTWMQVLCKHVGKIVIGHMLLCYP